MTGLPLRLLAGMFLVAALIAGMLLVFGVLAVSAVADHFGHRPRPGRRRGHRRHQARGGWRERRRFRREARRAIGSVTRPGALAAYSRAERRHGGRDRPA